MIDRCFKCNKESETEELSDVIWTIIYDLIVVGGMIVLFLIVTGK